MQTDTLFYRPFQNWPELAFSLLQLDYQPALSCEETQIMLALNDVQLKQTRFYQEIAAEERLEGEMQIVLRQLNKRFGPVPPWVQTKLGQADSGQLELWSERLLDAKILDEIFA